MVFRLKFTRPKVLLKEPEPVEIIEPIKQPKLKSKVVSTMPQINNKSKVKIIIPDKRKKKLTETISEINLDTDDEN